MTKIVEEIRKDLEQKRKDHEELRKALREFRERLIKQLQMQIEDLTHMDVITAVSSNIGGHIDSRARNMAEFVEAGIGESISLKVLDKSNSAGSADDPTKAKETTPKEEGDLNGIVVARTRYELDGDVALFLRGQQIDNGKRQNVTIDNDILALHQSNVKFATDNWQFFVRTALDALRAIDEIVER